jgi:hypothetical protein
MGNEFPGENSGAALALVALGRGLPTIGRAFLDSDTRLFVAMSRIYCPRSAPCKIPLNKEVKIAIKRKAHPEEHRSKPGIS